MFTYKTKKTCAESLVFISTIDYKICISMCMTNELTLVCELFSPCTTCSILSRSRSKKLSIRSPSMKPSAGSVFLSVWNDRQLEKLLRKLGGRETIHIHTFCCVITNINAIYFFIVVVWQLSPCSVIFFLQRTLLAHKGGK